MTPWTGPAANHAQLLQPMVPASSTVWCLVIGLLLGGLLGALVGWYFHTGRVYTEAFVAGFAEGVEAADAGRAPAGGAIPAAFRPRSGPGHPPRWSKRRAVDTVLPLDR
jgi:hypothetical protein